MQLITDQIVKNQNFGLSPLPRAEYDNCTFEGCHFSNGNLYNQHFTECRFTDCDLSNTSIKGSVFNNLSFSRCKMIGLKFEELNDLMVSFEFHDCTLNFSSFYGMKLKNIRFSNCRLVDTDFTQADLSGAHFGDCDMRKAIFNSTILEKTDFTTAFNLALDPEKNHIKKAKFSMQNVLGLLQKYDIEVL